MVAQIKTFAFIGIEAVSVDVQVKISPGNPNFTIVGLPDKSVGESKERVRAAILSTGLSWPYQRITVNLAPANLQKEGSHFDLAIALGIMIEIGVLSQYLVDGFFVLGELSLDGSVNAVNGIISAAAKAKDKDSGIICSQKNGGEVAWTRNPEIIATPNILTLINHLKGKQVLSYPETSKVFKEQSCLNLSNIKGQDNTKRALEIAAAGRHNLLMIGPPGVGKSMLASSLPGILPDCSLEEILEINMVASMSGKLRDGHLIKVRPFREVHHSCSMVAMVGGGLKVKPGEVSLAHNGVLFLDELAEFSCQVLDSLRQPLEAGSVNIARANLCVTYPADFQLIAAMNPCRCGFLGEVERECKKAPICGENYKNKISGPLLDRIDIVIDIGRIDFFAKQNSQKVEESQTVKARVVRCTKFQQKRQHITNSKINGEAHRKILCA